MASFESIPAELRDMIYHHTWLDTPLIDMLDAQGLKHTMDYIPKTREAQWDADGHEDIGQVGFASTLVMSTAPMSMGGLFHGEWFEPDQVPETPYGLPQWLLTNKAMLREGLNAFHLQGLSTLEVDLFELPGETYDFKDEIEGKVYDRNLFLALVAPCRAHRLRLQLTQNLMDEGNWKGTHTLQLGDKEVEFYKGLFKDIRSCGTNKQLQLLPMPYRHGSGDVKIDLAAFEKLVAPLASQLDRLDVRIRARWNDGLLLKYKGGRVEGGGDEAKDIEKDVAGETEECIFQEYVDMGNRALSGMELGDTGIHRIKKPSGGDTFREWRFLWTKVGPKQ